MCYDEIRASSHQTQQPSVCSQYCNILIVRQAFVVLVITVFFTVLLCYYLLCYYVTAACVCHVVGGSSVPSQDDNYNSPESYTNDRQHLHSDFSIFSLI